MEHVLLKATTVATDQGIFEAVISTPTRDRVKDIVEPQAMVNAMAKWAAVGKKMPLAYSHKDPATGHVVVVGHIDPSTARIVSDEVVAKGYVDQSIERGQETWRLVKSGTLSFSFGYLVPDGGAKRLRGGGLRIHEIDLYEVSVVPVAPANNDTRVLSYKDMSTAERQDMAKEMRDMAQMMTSDSMSMSDAECAAKMREMADEMESGIEEPASSEDDSKALRRRADAVELDHATGEKAPAAPEPEPEPVPESKPKVPSNELLDLKVQRQDAEDREEANRLLRVKAEAVAENAPPAPPPEAKPEPKPEPPSSELLDLKIARLERERNHAAAEKLRKQAESVAEDAPVVPPEPKPKAKPTPPDASALSKQIARLEREESEAAAESLRKQAETVAETAPTPPPEPKPEPKPEPPELTALTKRIAKLEQDRIEAEVRALRDQAKAVDEEAPVPESEPEPEPKPEAPDADEQRRKAAEIASEIEREDNDRRVPEVPEPTPEYAVLHITHEEMAGLAEGDLKAVWSAAFINDLADSAFLYIESGGKRDPDGKTVPRSLRHFPYKGPDGSVDLPHLRNALSRIPQSNLPQSVQEGLTAKAQRILDGQKSVDEIDKETKGSRSVDPLRAKADAVALDHLSDGASRLKSPRNPVASKPAPDLSLDELKRRTRDETLIALSGVEEL